MSTNIARQLDDNGYEAAESSSTRQSDGTTARTFEARGFHVLLNSDGTRKDYAPILNLATLELSAAQHLDSFSPVAARFADALVELVAPTAEPKRGVFRKRAEPKPRPLIRRTATSLMLVYKIDGVCARLHDLSLHWRPMLYAHGLMVSDDPSVLELQASLRNIPVDDGAAWADDRSPLTVHRDTLPEWNDDAMSAAVAGLVTEWVTRGELSVCGRFQEPAKPDGYYSAEAQLARQGVKIVRAVDEHTRRSPGDLGRERGRFG